MEKFDTIETSFICPNSNCKQEVFVNQPVYWTNNPNNNTYKKRHKIEAEDGIYNYSILDDDLKVKCEKCGQIHYYEIVVTNHRFTLNVIDENKYLERRHKGKYRILAHIDGSSNDFCRDCNDNLDESFSDYYIKCRNKIEIKHGTGDVLSCFIPSLGRGLNILRQIFKEKIINDKDIKISKHQEDEKLIVTYKYNPLDKNYLVQTIWKELNEKTNEMEDKQLNLYEDEVVSEAIKSNQILLDIDILDSEVYFTFRSKQTDYIANLVGAITTGANISPLSVKNLPKTKYTIPDNDIVLYNNIISKLPKTKITGADGKEREMVSGYIITKLVSGFDKIIQNVKGKEFNIKSDRKKKCLKGKEYINSLGEDIWEKFIEYLKEEVKQYT